MPHQPNTTRAEAEARAAERASFYRVTNAFGHAGRIGEMVGRKADPSYNDIELLFPDGQRRWFRFGEVEKVDASPSPPRAGRNAAGERE